MHKPPLGDWIRSINPRKTSRGAARSSGLPVRSLYLYWSGERAFPMSGETAERLARYLGVTRRTVLRNFAPAACAGCAARDRRIAELERALAATEQKLSAIGRQLSAAA
jgi:hypothetical protein